MLEVKRLWQFDVAILIRSRDIHLASFESIRSDCDNLESADPVEISL